MAKQAPPFATAACSYYPRIAHRPIRKRRHVPDLPIQYILSSGRQLVASAKRWANDEAQLLHGRTEGEFVVSYETTGGWVAVTKDVLTEVLGAGRDAKIVGLPARPRACCS